MLDLDLDDLDGATMIRRKSTEAMRSSRPNLNRFRSHVYFAVGSSLLFKSSSMPSQNAAEQEHLEARALRMFRRSASACGKDGGDAVMATAVVAFFNEFGMGGLEMDFREAERLYTVASYQGCGMAQARLAFLKTHGRPNIKINHSEADKWRQSCRHNGELAVAWLRHAAEARVPAAQFCLALCYYNGIAVASDDNEAFRWCELAATQGHPGAQNVLGNLYIEGSGCAVNPNLGLRWYIRAAERKEAAAIYNIGTLFERGLAVEEDPMQAFEWYIRASVFGSVNAQNVLGIFHEQGIGVAQNPARAVYYYRTAALNGHPHAQYNLGRCYHDGFGVTADDSLAVMWFRMGAEQGHALSLLSMGVCSEAGIGLTVDKQRAFTYYKRAAARDSVEAKRRLGSVSALSLLVPARALLSGNMRAPPSPVLRDIDDAKDLADEFAELSLDEKGAVVEEKLGARISDLPTEILIHILGFVDDLGVLSKQQFRAAVAFAADRSTLGAPAPVMPVAEKLVGPEIFLRNVGVPLLKWTCDCVGHCRKIKHYITLLEDPNIFDPEQNRL
ncbi:hypothetical protein HK101_011162 [Irineochytrium annulatum]|nr:hypothetical protein HK101_011162 [Irineochytrium annulatum]